jgi:DNA-binding PadR family transcriptional regulator
MSANRVLTELEGCVLGLVWDKGPCTAYTVRKQFLTSPSPHWSGSAGAIYPLMERLERQGLLRATAHTTGRRPSSRFVVTSAGLKALLGWLSPPWPDWVPAVPPDPLRTRMNFLDALPPAQQRKLLADAEQLVRAHLGRVQEEAERERENGFYNFMTARGAVLAMTARLEWLHEVRQALQNARQPVGAAARGGGQRRP